LRADSASDAAVGAYSGRYGVYASGASYGVYAYSGNTGIYNSGGTYGNYAISSSTGVYGSGSTYGVYGSGSYGGHFLGTTGVYGSGTSYGVYAYNYSTTALYGYASGYGYGVIYGYRSSSINGGGYSSIKSATYGYAYWGNSYAFGVYGRSFGDYYRTGGTFGYVSGDWGCCGYKNSGGGYYGGYFYGGYTGGSGKNADYFVDGVGIGAYGGAVGGWIRGEVMGLYTEGEYFASYANGDTYATGIMATIQDTGEARTAFYGITSPDVEIMTHGTGVLYDGQAAVDFDKEFLNAVSADTPIVVTVSPRGLCDQLCIVEQDAAGFLVQETNGGKSDVEFNWIAIARRAGYDVRPELNADLAAKDFDVNMLQVANNENDLDSVALPVWYDGESLQWTESPRPVPVKEAPEEPYIPEAVEPDNEIQGLDPNVEGEPNTATYLTYTDY
jgi:hypothetical protein